MVCHERFEWNFTRITHSGYIHGRVCNSRPIGLELAPISSNLRTYIASNPPITIASENGKPWSIPHFEDSFQKFWSPGEGVVGVPDPRKIPRDVRRIVDSKGTDLSEKYAISLRSLWHGPPFYGKSTASLTPVRRKTGAIRVLQSSGGRPAMTNPIGKVRQAYRTYHINERRLDRRCSVFLLIVNSASLLVAK